MVLEYLPTFALKVTQMWVNIPYMEHMGYNLSSLYVWGRRGCEAKSWVNVVNIIHHIVNIC